jgi:hypothetical protein
MYAFIKNFENGFLLRFKLDTFDFKIKPRRDELKS